MTERFVSAADLMSRVLGAPRARYAVIPHPISSASRAELERTAKTAAAECVRMLTT